MDTICGFHKLARLAREGGLNLEQTGELIQKFFDDRLHENCPDCQRRMNSPVPSWMEPEATVIIVMGTGSDGEKAKA